MVGKFRLMAGDERKRSLTMDAFITKGGPPPPLGEALPSTCPKRKRDILSYFAPRLRDQEASPASLACQKCGKRFVDSEVAEYQEHLDFHLAREIQDAWNQADPSELAK